MRHIAIQPAFHAPLKYAVVLQAVATLASGAILDGGQLQVIYLMLSLPLWLSIGGFAIVRRSPSRAEIAAVTVSPLLLLAALFMLANFV